MDIFEELNAPTMPDAACIPHDPELWFPKSGASHAHKVASAKSICAGCPERTTCLTETLAYEADNAGGRHGIYGGLTPGERARLAEAAA